MVLEPCMLSGKPVRGNFALSKSVADTRCLVASSLSVSPARVQLLAQRQVLADNDRLPADEVGPLVVCLLPEPAEVEAEFAEAAGVACIADLSHREVLMLERKGIKTLPDRIGVLAALEVLVLQGNRLRIVPSSIGCLARLETLDLRNNKLVTLPESFGNLTSLLLLNIRRNQLAHLADDFGQLVSLRCLEAGHNVLTWLPSSFGQLVALHSLDLRGN